MPPETATTSPLASVVTVGYQRPAFMLGAGTQTLLAASYVLEFGSPTSLEMWPPAMNRRPSARNAWPLQKTSYPGRGIKEVIAAAGSQRRVSTPLGPFP